MNFSVSYAMHNDCESLSRVIKKVVEAIPYYNQTAKHDEVLKFTKEELEKKIAEDAYSVIVAKSEDGEIAGFCLSRFDDYTIWLEWFGIDEKYRNRKLAYPLLQKLDETVQPRKCHKIWCDCRTGNTASIHILSRSGYMQLVTIPNHWYGQDFILWQKPIAP